MYYKLVLQDKLVQTEGMISGLVLFIKLPQLSWLLVHGHMEARRLMKAWRLALALETQYYVVAVQLVHRGLLQLATCKPSTAGKRRADTSAR